ncbi:MAG: anthranilate synthase component I [Chloroflexi bacterium]|nr:anthranilate synthase component I [Chloroflexota bacterium]
MTSLPSTRPASFCTPTLEEALALRGSGLLPIYRECLADTETPVSAYAKLRSDGPSFLLESVEGGERQGRYSIVATEPTDTLRFEGGMAHHQGPDGTDSTPCADPLLALEAILKERRAVATPGLPRFHGGALGFLGFDLIRCYEEIGPTRPDPYGLPLGELAFCETLLVFDHVRHTLKVVAHARLDGDLEAEYRAAEQRIDRVLDRLRKAAPPDATAPRLLSIPTLPRRAPVGQSNVSRERYEAMVLEAKEHIAAGDIFQVVPSQRFSVPTSVSALALYRALRVVNPSPYMYLLDFGPYQLIGSSPELLVGVEDGLVSTHPIAGSRPRGATEEQDAALEAELRASEKDRAEHIMLVDLGRNDVGRVAIPGTVAVDGLMFIERYSHVMHLVTHVNGRLRADLSPLDALRACFPAGTVSGAPKIRAMQIISELEAEGRGPYAGAIGYFGYSGSMETAITIRTLVLKDGVAHVQAGGGIVADSDPAEEYEETVSKAQGMLTALRLAEALAQPQSHGEATVAAQAAP